MSLTLAQIFRTAHDKPRTAWHEAGHIVVARALGGFLGDVKVTMLFGGGVAIGGVSGDDRAVVIAAGPVAEGMYINSRVRGRVGFHERDFCSRHGAAEDLRQFDELPGRTIDWDEACRRAGAILDEYPGNFFEVRRLLFRGDIAAVLAMGATCEEQAPRPAARRQSPEELRAIRAKMKPDSLGWQLITAKIEGRRVVERNFSDGRKIIEVR